MSVMGFLRRIIREDEKESEAMHSRDRIASQELADSFIANPDFPFLVSFSRTGSHWLRMLMELYFEKPSLKLLFFQTVKATDSYTCFHTHDLDLKVEAGNVIYLYRDPVDTIFSQMKFHGQDLTKTELVDGWVELYARHLDKWLLTEKFTRKKIILSYESMRSNLPGEFIKLCAFFNTPFDDQKLSKIAERVSKEKIKEKTGHDPRVINLDKNYPASREKFREMYAERIYQYTFEKYPELKKFF